ncbi:hypothetical protein JTE90_002352 [Oedothorax gibbosus]|uniref:Uncharacterized protein n=1 Tax=Oedothorax gibbosus TaxID=931172 RepID=A0AAV6UJW1_9ARAC|nr:hypothetical protein JTE90_002352 [Oedothorax gibbosus]
MEEVGPECFTIPVVWTGGPAEVPGWRVVSVAVTERESKSSFTVGGGIPWGDWWTNFTSEDASNRRR